MSFCLSCFFRVRTLFTEGVQVVTRHPASVRCHGIKDTKCMTMCKCENCAWRCRDLSCICRWAHFGTDAFQLSLGAWEASTLACVDINSQRVSVAASCETCFILDKKWKRDETPPPPPVEQLALLWSHTWQQKKKQNKKWKIAMEVCQDLVCSHDVQAWRFWSFTLLLHVDFWLHQLVSPPHIWETKARLAWSSRLDGFAGDQSCDSWL